MAILSGSLFYDLIVLLATTIVLVVAFFKWKFSYWNRIGLPQLDPSIPYGDVLDLFHKNISISEICSHAYKKFKARGVRHGGVYVGPRPVYFPTDPQLVKHILQVDFSHFVNHGFYTDEESNPLYANLLRLNNEKWKRMRASLTPAFTSGKMKMMFQTLVDCASGLTEILDRSAGKNEEINSRDVLARFTADVIGSVAFGIDCNTLKEPDSEFGKFVKKSLMLNTKQKIHTILQLFVPHRILKMMKLKLMDPEVEEFFLKTVEHTVAYREENNIYRKDFMHLLLQLKNRGSIDDEIIIDGEEVRTNPSLTLTQLAAQCHLFFGAGYETSSATMTFALYELATDMKIQKRLRNEICSVLERYNNEITYDGIKEMTYMDQVVHETLRKYPPIGMVMRQCNEDYAVPGTDVCIKKGIYVLISVLGLHTDPEYFPDPEIFDPERFSKDNKQNMTPFTWIPFAEGPRICIGARFGVTQVKVGLTTLLKNHKFTLNSKTKRPLKFNPKTIMTVPEGGVWVNVEKLN